MNQATKWTVTVGLLTGILAAVHSKSVKRTWARTKDSVTETRQLINRLSEQLKTLKISKVKLLTRVQKLNFSNLFTDLTRFKHQLQPRLAKIQADEQKIKQRSNH